MNRFQKRTNRSGNVKLLISVLIFCFVLFLFFGGLSSVTKTASKKELESLKQAVIQSSVQCYALEGFYPESLDYLEDHYGITYDKDKYIVSYEVTASNLMPSVMVIPLKEEDAYETK